MSWSYHSSGNKLAHALNGNRRNMGYKYLAWNYARGFLSENKIDDLKIAINRHKPFLIGVSIVDLRRNDCNSDIFATNNLSMEQRKQ